MLIAHIPAGYIATRFVSRILPSTLCQRIHTSSLYTFGIIGSVFPDFDMFYYYLIDKRQHLHHSYWTHIPLFWLLIIVVSYVLLSFTKKTSFKVYLSVFYLNVFIHLLLDTPIGKIRWLFPFSAKDFFLFEVPARYGWWVWNFIFHWSFLFEIAIVSIAGSMALHSIKQKREQAFAPSVLSLEIADKG